MHGRRLPFVILLLAPTACLMQPSAATRVLGPPRDVIHIAEAVFADLDIPIQRVNENPAEIDSGSFTVEGTWGGDPVEARVDCGENDDDQPRAGLGRVELIVTLTAQPRRAPMGGNDPTRTIDYQASRVDLDSRGAVTLSDSQRHGCHLTPEFGRRIISEISQRSGGPGLTPLRPPVPTPVPPTSAR